MNFHAIIDLDGKTATGVRVPDDIVEALGGGKRPRVRVTLAGFSYQTTVAGMGGQFKFPVTRRSESGLDWPRATRSTSRSSSIRSLGSWSSLPS